MSISGYPEYTESGIPWLGVIPSDWQLLPFFSRFSERKISNKGMKCNNLLSLSYGRIVNKDITTLDGLLPASFETYQIVHKDDIVFRLTDLQNDKRSLRSAIVSEKGIITSAYLAVVVHGFDAAFSSYLFRAYDLMKVFYSMGGGLRQSMKYDDMKWLMIAAPTVNEQAQIARFLGHETAKIDTLIYEQKRLIELLKEKRQAVISHAVTKGLDPDVPMKDSGVEWLGEVPAHWTKKRLKNVSPFIAVGIVVNPSSYVAEDGLPFIYGGEVKEGYIDLSKTRKISALDSKKNKKTLLETGDLVTMRVGYPGVTAIVPPSCEGGNCASVMLVKRGDFDSRWLCAVMNSRLIRQQVEVVQYGAAQKQFNIADAVEFWLLEPPQTEQAVIADFIAAKSAGFDQLMDKASQSMGLLAERRSALISAAVTGKIDVRDWQPPVDERAFNEEAKQAGMETTA